MAQQRALLLEVAVQRGRALDLEQQGSDGLAHLREAAESVAKVSGSVGKDVAPLLERLVAPGGGGGGGGGGGVEEEEAVTVASAASAVDAALRVVAHRMAAMARRDQEGSLARVVEVTEERDRLRERVGALEEALRGVEQARAAAEAHVQRAQEESERRLAAAGEEFGRNYLEAIAAATDARDSFACVEARCSELEEALREQQGDLAAAQELRARGNELEEDAKRLRLEVWEARREEARAREEGARVAAALGRVLKETGPRRAAARRGSARLRLLRAWRRRDSAAKSRLKLSERRLGDEVTRLRRAIGAGQKRLKRGAEELVKARAGADRAARLEVVLGKSEDRRIAADAERRKASEALSGAQREAEAAARRADHAEERAERIRAEAERSVAARRKAEAKAQERAAELLGQLEAAEGGLRDSQAAASRLLRDLQAVKSREAELGAQAEALRERLDCSVEAHMATLKQLEEAETAR